MSVVTDVFVIVGDVEMPYESAESRAPKIAEEIVKFLGKDNPDWKPWAMPVISLMRDDWGSLQNGSKVAGSACIWFGYNFADMPGLEAHLKAKGFEHLTIWSHHENKKDQPPRVVNL